MSSLPQIIELFSIMVIVASFIGLMWLAGHIYFKVENYKRSQQDANTPPSDEQEEKLIAWWRD